MKYTLYLILFTVLQLNAQEKEITGTIIDEYGIPFPGVNIVVSNTKKEAQTDFDGNYVIKVDKGDVIVFSFLGYRTQTKKINKNNIISFAMKEDPDNVYTGCYFGTPRINPKVTYQYATIKFN